MSKIQTISVICFLSYSVIIGALVFSRGFLLNRKVISDKAGPCLDTQYQHHYHYVDDIKEKDDRGRGDELLSNLTEAASWCNQSPVFKKAILILVDALRYDFVQRMEFLSSVITKEKQDQPVSGDEKKRRKTELLKESSCLFRFVADPPTTTMQRLKALMTGTMPTFIDASANFNSYEVEEDSLIYQLYTAGKKLAFLGDDTWLSLFPPKYFTSSFVEAYPSFNAWDLDTVDRAINATLRGKIFPSSNASNGNHGDWDVLIAHILGVDHCGHRYGPSHPEMVRKIREADEIIQYVYERMSEDTLLVVFGDHGMTSTGDHGGDSRDETDSAVVFISKRNIKSGSSLGTINSATTTFQCPAYTSGISQIDLVPTLATLLGVPIPFSSLGQVIPHFLSTRRELYTDAISSNAAQVHRYMSKLGIGFPSSITQEYSRLQEAFTTFQLARSNVSSKARLNTLSHQYLTQVKQFALSQWTQFNVPMIYAGVVISTMALLSLALYLQSLPYLLLVSSQYTVLSWLWPSLPLWSALLNFIKSQLQIAPSTASSNLAAVIVSALGGLAMFLLCIMWKLLHLVGRSASSTTKNKSSKIALEELCSLTLYLLTCLATLSNSFVINEGAILGSSILLVVFLHLTLKKDSDSLSNPSEDSIILLGTLRIKRVKCSMVCFLMLGVLLRTCSIFFRCREELQECNEEYLLHKQLSSLPDSWLVHKYVRYSIALVSLAIFVVAFRLSMLHRKCLFTRRPAAYVAKFIPSLLVVFLGVFWALQGLPFNSSSATKLRPILNYIPWVFQASTFISLVLVWLKPLFSQASGLNTASLLYHLGSPSATCPECTSSKKFRMRTSLLSAPSSTYNSSTKVQFLEKVSPQKNGIQKVLVPNGVLPKKPVVPPIIKPMLLDLEKQPFIFDDPSSFPFSASDDVSSAVLLFSTLFVVLLSQVTSVGIAPVVSIIIPYVIVCLIGIFRTGSSWSSIVSWVLASQFLFYGTGHQPIFSAIPWDSAFLSSTDGQSFTDASDSMITWIRPCLAILGNLHVSQIIFSLALPLLSYLANQGGLSSSNLCRHHLLTESCRLRRRRAYSDCGKFILLHGLKLLGCMFCAGFHRRHLMVWKIFAPKFIFELVSFIVTASTVIFSLVFVTRIDYLYHRNRHRINLSPSGN